MKFQAHTTHVSAMSFLFTFFLFALLSYSSCSHVHSGDDENSGQYSSEDGTVHTYVAHSNVVQPTVFWEELLADGLSVVNCNNHRIAFNGEYDEDDFDVGNVLAFLKEDYHAIGCPRSPLRDTASEKDPCVFRRIISVEPTSGGLKVLTEHEYGYKVVPEVHVSVDPEKTVSRKLNIDNQLDNTLRDDIDEVSDIERHKVTLPNRSFKLLGSATVKPSGTISYDGGITDFNIFRTSTGGRATFEIGLYARPDVSLTFKSGEVSLNGEVYIYNHTLPYLGFDFNLRGFGKLQGGVYMGATAVASLDFSTTLVVKYKAVMNVDREIEVKAGLTGFSAQAVRDTSYLYKRVFSNEASFTDLDAGVGKEINVFAGLKPYVGVGFTNFPLVGDCHADLSVKMGVDVSGKVSSAGYPAVTTGGTLGTCDVCHFLEGAVKFKIKDLAFNATQGSHKYGITITQSVYDRSFGTICAGEKPSGQC